MIEFIDIFPNIKIILLCIHNETFKLLFFAISSSFHISHCHLFLKLRLERYLIVHLSESMDLCSSKFLLICQFFILHYSFIFISSFKNIIKNTQDYKHTDGAKNDADHCFHIIVLLCFVDYLWWKCWIEICIILSIGRLIYLCHLHHQLWMDFHFLYFYFKL